jgi:hypothetical protein
MIFVIFLQRDLYRMRTLVAREKVFRRTVQDCTLSLI